MSQFWISFGLLALLISAAQGSQPDSVKVQWLDPSGHVLDLAWRTISYWEWDESKGRPLRPALHVWIEIPANFNLKSASEGNLGPPPSDKIPFNRESHALHLVLHGPLATIRLTHTLPNGVSEQGGLSLNVGQLETALLIHGSCGSESLGLRRVEGSGSVLFIGVRCETSKGAGRAIVSRSEEVIWADPQTGERIPSAPSELIFEYKQPLELGVGLARIAVLSGGDLSVFSLESRSPVGKPGPKNAPSLLIISGSFSPGELFGETSTAVLRELTILAGLEANYSGPHSIFVPQLRLRTALGSFFSSQSSFMHQTDIKAGVILWRAQSSSFMLSPGLRLFVFRNEEVRSSTLALVGPSIELTLSTPDFLFRASLSPLGDRPGAISLHKVQWDMGMEIPLFRTEGGQTLSGSLGLTKTSEWDSNGFELMFVTAGIGASL